MIYLYYQISIIRYLGTLEDAAILAVGSYGLDASDRNNKAELLYAFKNKWLDVEPYPYVKRLLIQHLYLQIYLQNDPLQYSSNFCSFFSSSSLLSDSFC